MFWDRRPTCQRPWDSWPPSKFFHRVERRFHSRDSNRQPLLWDLGVSLPSSSSLRSSRTEQLVDFNIELRGRLSVRTTTWVINQGMYYFGSFLNEKNKCIKSLYHLILLGPLHTWRAKIRDHEIVRAQKQYPKAVSRHFQNHVVWSWTLRCSVKSYVTRPSTKWYFYVIMFMY